MGSPDNFTAELNSNSEKKPIIRVWDPQLGMYRYSCGCIQIQDGYELCDKHKPGGYKSLMAERILQEPRTAAGSLD